VEDTADVRDTVAQILTSRGCRVLPAADAREGLAIIEQHCADLDILLTDIVIPGGTSGTALAARARQQCPHLSILLMTGYADHPLANTDHVVLRKPFSEAELVDTIHRALARRRTGSQS
jgi:CheY-like chemotaxis protein